MSDHSIKKKKKRTEQERSGGKAATGLLATYHERHDDEQQIEDESTGAQSQSQPFEEGLKSATTLEQKMEKLINIVTSNSHVVHQLSDQMSSFDDRLRTLEVSRRLSKGSGYYTPKKAKRKPSVLFSVHNSSLKRDWRTLEQRRRIN